MCPLFYLNMFGLVLGMLYEERVRRACYGD